MTNEPVVKRFRSVELGRKRENVTVRFEEHEHRRGRSGSAQVASGAVAEIPLQEQVLDARADRLLEEVALRRGRAAAGGGGGGRFPQRPCGGRGVRTAVWLGGATRAGARSCCA